MRLLMIEDDASLAAVLFRALVDEGYSVDVAARAVDGRHLLQSSEYDLVVLDLGLPDGDGLALCREARAHGVVAPILVLTARDGLLNKVEGLDAGADDYLTKPFDFPELAARIRALLRRGSEDRSPILQVDDIRLDPAARRVWRGAVTVPLTAREFSLLEYLMRQQGQGLDADRVARARVGRALRRPLQRRRRAHREPAAQARSPRVAGSDRYRFAASATS